MKKRIFYIIIAFLSVIYIGCKEEGRIDHFDDSAPAPAQVEIVANISRPGGAVLKYKVPADNNLRYVRAEYEIQPGNVREAISSYFADSLVLEGFGDTQTHAVKVYSVGKNEKTSEPVKTSVTPDMPPIHATTKSMAEAFGGVSITVTNPLKANLAVVLYGDTAHLGYQSYLETFYTSAQFTNFKYRGLKADTYDFSLFLRDRWGYVSETLSATLTPKHETSILNDKWTTVFLSNDIPLANQPWPVSNLWDNQIIDWWGMNISPPVPMPASFTINLNQTISLSRLKIWQIGTLQYQNANIKKFELYGSMNANPSWDDGWIPLGKFDLVRPSGQKEPTAEDIAYAMQGIDCEIEISEFAPNPFQPIRYLRFKIFETYQPPAPTEQLLWDEVRLWGNIINPE